MAAELSPDKADLEWTSQERLNMLMESVLDYAIFTTNLDGGILDWSLGAEQILGYTAAEAVGMNCEMIFTPEDREKGAPEQEKQKALTEGRAEDERWHVRKDGSYFWGSGVMTSLRRDGVVHGFAKLLRDLTEQKRADERQRLLSEAGAILMSSLDPQQTLANMAKVFVPEHADWCSIHVVEREGNVKAGTVAHVDPERVKWVKQIQQRYPIEPEADTGVNRILASGKPELDSVVTEEMVLAAARDEEHAEVLRQLNVKSVLIVPLRSRAEVIGTITLISGQPGRYQQSDVEFMMELAHRAALAYDNARLHEELEQRVEERTQELRHMLTEMEGFTYTVSHDLRTPLRSIMATSRILLEDFGEAVPPEAADQLERQARAAKKLGDLIDDLLRLSRLGRQEMRKTDVDLSALAAEVVAELGERKDHNVSFEIQPGMHAYGDADLLKLLLSNLLGNAVKFSPRGGTVRFGVEERGGRPVFFVRDEGIGFDPKYSHKLFQPFERLHRDEDFPGTGIGLANVSRVVARHGGTVGAEGQIGQGATFYFSLG